MKIQYKDLALTEISKDVLVVGLIAGEELSGDLLALDKASGGFFSDLHKEDHLPSKATNIRTFYNVPNIQAKSVAVIAYDATKSSLAKASKAITKYLREYDCDSAAVSVLTVESDVATPTLQTRILVQNLLDADYVCNNYKSETKDKKKICVDILSNSQDIASVEHGVEQGIAIAKGMNTLKHLGNAPGNVCTPRYLARYAKKLASKFDSLSVEILKENDLKKLKMGALLSVSKGSVEKPRLIKLEHKGGEGDPIVLVGKGVTFDSGGISLKPGAGMDEMKYDMCGAGSVIGTMKTIAMLNLPINVIGIVPAVENMPSGCATKPGDIVTSMSGKTIEVLNTDAEGRMILCDALTYAQQFKPKALIDIATLTGAVIIALGRHPSGVMSNDESLTQDLLNAGQASGDRAWQLPIWEDYLEQLKSPFADLQNIGGREAGSITAGCFLGEFTKDVPWAHIDIAATAWQNRSEGATGRPVPLLVEYVLSQLEK
ncbi:MAG: leucyl aminopeptidase [Gammaproteobacteria bacterium]|nr:leucyl aminopeptidase [Gammaproteobacteria bacterium]